MNTKQAPHEWFVSSSYKCPYLEHKTASTLFLEAGHPIDKEEFSTLIRFGFRRSGGTIYKPHCQHCNKCVPVRISAKNFLPNRSQKRCYHRNSDLQVDIVPPSFDEEHFDLYCRYQSFRHSGDAMDNNDPLEYQKFLVESPFETLFFEFRLNGKVVALVVSDCLNDGFSCVYSFFDPQLPKRSLGTFAIIKQLEITKVMKHNWLYLGYWIKDCRKMNYKSNFKPIFGYLNESWQPLQL